MFTVTPITDDLPVVLEDDHPTLRMISEPVTVFDSTLRRVVGDMLSVINARPARGLAAVQIGILKRVIVVYIDKKTRIFVNPVFERKLNRFTVEREGCLSVAPRFWRNVSRPAKCDVAWQDINGNAYQETLTGELARVVQHEMDHLDGILITDHPQV